MSMASLMDRISTRSKLTEFTRGVVLTDPHGRPQETNCVNETGLYSLVLGSRKNVRVRFC